MLEVKVAGIKQMGKTVHLAIYSQRDQFPSEIKAFMRTSFISTDKNGVAGFEIPYGEYAVAVFVDENGNGKLDKNIFGFPKEQFGFSNDFRPKTSAPKFENCSFVFSEHHRQVVITLRK